MPPLQSQSKFDTPDTRQRISDDLHSEIHAWFDHVYPILRQSEWGKYLIFRNIDLLEATKFETLVQFLQVVRQRSSNTPATHQSYYSKARSKIRTKFLDLQSFYQYGIQNARWLPRTSDYLFWPREPTHIAQMVPVYQTLQGFGAQVEWITERSFGAKLMANQNIKSIYAPLAWPTEVSKATIWSKRTCYGMRRSLGITLPEIPNYQPKEIEVILGRILQEPIKRAVLAIAIAESSIEAIRPKVLLVGYDLTIEGRAATMTAKRMGVPTACLMHGLLTGPEEKDHIVDKFSVYGESSRSILLNRGIPANRIEVCGAPHLDKYINHNKDIPLTKTNISEIIGFSPATPIILVAMSGPGHSTSVSHHKTLIQTIVNVAEKFPNCKFIVKLHRKDQAKYYNEVMHHKKSALLDVISDKDQRFPQDILYWLSQSSCVITGVSTIIIEAAFLLKPIITLDLFNEYSNSDIIKTDITIHCTKEKDLKFQLEAILNSTKQEDQKRKEKISSSLIYKPDGRASERVARMLLDLAKIPL